MRRFRPIPDETPEQTEERRAMYRQMRRELDAEGPSPVARRPSASLTAGQLEQARADGDL